MEKEKFKINSKKRINKLKEIYNDYVREEDKELIRLTKEVDRLRQLEQRYQLEKDNYEMKIERLNKENERLRTALNTKETIINELEKWLGEYEKGTYSYGGINDLMQIPIHRIRYKIEELKGSDKE